MMQMAGQTSGLRRKNLPNPDLTDEDYMDVQNQMKARDLMQEQREFYLKENKTEEEQVQYNMQLMKSLGAETMEEAMEII